MHLKPSVVARIRARSVRSRGKVVPFRSAACLSEKSLRLDSSHRNATTGILQDYSDNSTSRHKAPGPGFPDALYWQFQPGLPVRTASTVCVEQARDGY